ncbi:hypothetical protein O988_06272, partial [Pseudogymnoascus sp. VKM F-3808]
LQDALPSSTSILPATADLTEDAHGNILSITPGNIESTEVQPLRSSQGVESNLVAINATEGRWEVEALLAKSKVGNVIWYLVKWAGFQDGDNTWQKRDDISTGLINDFEANYQGNYLGVQLLKKRERRGRNEYFVEWKGRPEAENSWEKENTIHCERIIEFKLHYDQTILRPHPETTYLRSCRVYAPNLQSSQLWASTQAIQLNLIIASCFKTHRHIEAMQQNNKAAREESAPAA